MVFLQASFVKRYSACCSRNSAYVVSTNLYLALKIILNHRNQTDVSSLKDFSKNPYTFTYFCHYTAIYFFSNRFICFDWLISSIRRSFSPSARSFSHLMHIAWGIIKLISWTTSFLEERLDIEIVWWICFSFSRTKSAQYKYQNEPFLNNIRRDLKKHQIFKEHICICWYDEKYLRSST